MFITSQRQVVVSLAIAAGLGLAGCSLLFSPADGAAQGDGGEQSDSGNGGADGGPDAPDAASEPTLRGAGLIARYYFDDAEAAPESLTDSAGGPSNNDLKMTTAMGFSVGGQQNHRGLQWAVMDSTGNAFTSFDNTGFTSLAGQTQMTFECTLNASTAGASPAALLHIQPAGAAALTGVYSLQLEKVDDTIFTALLVFDGQQQHSWTGAVKANDPVVLHLVLDTEAALAPERAMLYANGSALTPVLESGVEIALNATLNVSDTSTITIGNAGPEASVSIEGRIGYTAVYGARLAEADIAHNVAILIDGDDRP